LLDELKLEVVKISRKIFYFILFYFILLYFYFDFSKHAYYLSCFVRCCSRSMSQWPSCSTLSNSMSSIHTRILLHTKSGMYRGSQFSSTDTRRLQNRILFPPRHEQVARKPLEGYIRCRTRLLFTFPSPSIKTTILSVQVGSCKLILGQLE